MAFRTAFTILLTIASVGPAFAQKTDAPLVLKAGTGVTVASTGLFIPKKATLGDTVNFVTAYPIRVGAVAVVPGRTKLLGRVTALKPKVLITLNPVVVAGTTIEFAGHPFEVKAAKHDMEPRAPTPPELAWHAPAPEKAQFFFDYGTVEASQQGMLEEDRKRGGCGIQKLLHSRPGMMKHEPDAALPVEPPQ